MHAVEKAKATCQTKSNNGCKPHKKIQNVKANK